MVRESMRRARWILAACALAGCGTEPPRDARPNVLWIVWDTVRADHLGLYGYERPTTPFLSEWAREGRVFEDCLSVANATVPAHASMFTGLWPSEHGAHNSNRDFRDGETTLAEIFQGAGYDTYLYSANPYVSRVANLVQGFETVELPWQAHLQDEARPLAEDRARRSGRTFREYSAYAFKSIGTLTRRRLVSWLDERDGGRPYFAFLNYMEAHQPLVPLREHREEFMSTADVEESYRHPGIPNMNWLHTFRLIDYPKRALRGITDLYDASILELDALLRDLIEELEDDGRLENTIVVLTSDHGEHLGEHHMMDHQYSVYQPLIDVPLVLHYPPAVPAGRDERPVMNVDLFPTLLELADLSPPRRSRAVSLLAPRDERARVSECPDAHEGPIETVRATHPDFDPTPWLRTLRALRLGADKLIWASDGRHELYDLAADPNELEDRSAVAGELAERLHERLDTELESFRAAPADAGAEPSALGREQLERLEELGYVEAGDD